MGGFRVNGCGATDHFKKIKSLGIHVCPVCQKESEFFLEKAQLKVDIFFIPTLTLKSRYAVMCSKCKQGEFCSDQWAVNLIDSTGPIPMIFESQAQPAVQAAAPAPAVQIAAPGPAAQIAPPAPAVQIAPPVPAAQIAAPGPAVQIAPPGPAVQIAPPVPAAQIAAPGPAVQIAPPAPAAQIAPPEPAARIVPPEPAVLPVPEAPAYVPSGQATQQPVFKAASVPSFFKCSYCGVTQLREGAFCSFCGKPAPEDPNASGPGRSEEAPDAMSVCPDCGNRQKSGLKFCSNCGCPMDAQVSSERVCPSCGAKIEASAAFCMECGMKL